jgi:hypothetical protein
LGERADLRLIQPLVPAARNADAEFPPFGSRPQT